MTSALQVQGGTAICRQGESLRLQEDCFKGHKFFNGPARPWRPLTLQSRSGAATVQSPGVVERNLWLVSQGPECSTPNLHFPSEWTPGSSEVIDLVHAV